MSVSAVYLINSLPMNALNLIILLVVIVKYRQKELGKYKNNKIYTILSLLVLYWC